MLGDGWAPVQCLNPGVGISCAGSAGLSFSGGATSLQIAHRQGAARFGMALQSVSRDLVLSGLRTRLSTTCLSCVLCSSPSLSICLPVVQSLVS